MSRLFIGIPVDLETKDKLVPILQELQIFKIKVVPIQNLHFTIKFLGEVHTSEIEEINNTLQNISKQYHTFTLKLENIGCFPNSTSPQVVWIGTHSKEMLSLMYKIETELQYIRKNEHQENLPHLTLARINNLTEPQKFQSWLKKYAAVNFGSINVDKIVLFESILSKGGPEYKIIREFSLLS